MSNFFSEHGQAGPPVRPTPARTPLPKRTVLPAPKAPRRVSLNPMQQAQLNVRRELAPQYSAVDQEAARQNQAIQSYTAAVMQQLAGLAPQIQGDYNNAINAQQGMVDAAANSLRSVNPSGDVARLLDAVGAPAAQGQQIQGNLNNTFNGGAAVGQYVNGVSPLGALRSQGEAATSLARLQPSFQALAGRQALISALANQADTRAKIAAQAPGMIQDQLNTFTSNAAKRQQLGLEAQSLGLKTQNQAFGQNLALTKLKSQQQQFIARQTQQIQEFNSRQQLAQNKLALPNASLSGRLGFLVDSHGKPILDVKGHVQKLPGSASKSGVKMTSSTLRMAGKQADVYYYGVPPKQHFNTVTQQYEVVPGTGIPGITYPQALSQLQHQFGLTRQRAAQILNDYYAPGERGRPDVGAMAAGKRTRAANASARKGKDKTGLGIQTVTVKPRG